MDSLSMLQDRMLIDRASSALLVWIAIVVDDLVVFVENQAALWFVY